MAIACSSPSHFVKSFRWSATVTHSDEPEFRGEILRNLRSPDLEDWQPLNFTVAPGPIEILLTGEKPETTYLDAIAVDVNGERLHRQSCLGEAPPAYCEEDDEYFVNE